MFEFIVEWLLLSVVCNALYWIGETSLVLTTFGRFPRSKRPSPHKAFFLVGWGFMVLIAILFLGFELASRFLWEA